MGLLLVAPSLAALLTGHRGGSHSREMDGSRVCEACRSAPVAVVVADDDPTEPYRVCRPCAERLTHRALRPAEWFNLASIHGWTKFLLHDDFYDEDGEASQPDVDEYSNDGLLAPCLDDVGGSLPRLIDFCVTRWSLDEAVFSAMRAYPPRDVLDAIIRRAEQRNRHVLETILTLAANVLGSVGADWVRAQRDRAWAEGLAFSWCEAAAKCLGGEGLDMAIERLDGLSGAQRREAKNGLLWFRSRKVLDWIETHVPGSNVTDDWGRLAALSALDLSRVRRWIAAGRPLSLVALDALAAFIPRAGQAPVMRQLEPALEGVSDRAEIIALLDAARAADATPRTTGVADFIAAHVDQLRVVSGGVAGS